MKSPMLLPYDTIPCPRGSNVSYYTIICMMLDYGTFLSTFLCKWCSHSWIACSFVTVFTQFLAGLLYHFSCSMKIPVLLSSLRKPPMLGRKTINIILLERAMDTFVFYKRQYQQCRSTLELYSVGHTTHVRVNQSPSTICFYEYMYKSEYSTGGSFLIQKE